MFGMNVGDAEVLRGVSLNLDDRDQQWQDVMGLQECKARRWMMYWESIGFEMVSPRGLLYKVSCPLSIEL